MNGKIIYFKVDHQEVKALVQSILAEVLSDLPVDWAGPPPPSVEPSPTTSPVIEEPARIQVRDAYFFSY